MGVLSFHSQEIKIFFRNMMLVLLFLRQGHIKIIIAFMSRKMMKLVTKLNHIFVLLRVPYLKSSQKSRPEVIFSVFI